MATKSSTKTKTADKKAKTASNKTATKQDLLYIMSPQCGWCKKADPVVDELIKDGAKITKIDMTTPDGQARANEVKSKHNAQCGTPLFIDAESGNMKCGFAEKDVLQKWANGEEIPKPPQPKSPPPPPPADLETASADEVATWKTAYQKWTEENKHLPNLIPFDQIEQRVRQAQIARKNQPNAAPAGNPGASNVQSNQSFNNDFYYVVVNGNKEVVMSEGSYISSLKQQYFQRDNDGRLTKVVGDVNFKHPGTAAQMPPNAANVNSAPAISQKQADAKIAKNNADNAKKEAVKNEKSKANTKTIKGI